MRLGAAARTETTRTRNVFTTSVVVVVVVVTEPRVQSADPGVVSATFAQTQRALVTLVTCTCRRILSPLPKQLPKANGAGDCAVVVSRAACRVFRPSQSSVCHCRRTLTLRPFARRSLQIERAGRIRRAGCCGVVHCAVLLCAVW